VSANPVTRRISKSLLAAGIVSLAIAVADTFATGGFGLGTLWGLVFGIIFLGAVWWEWERGEA
jgi:hypothetical protein